MDEKPEKLIIALKTGDQEAIDAMGASGGRTTAENNKVRHEIDKLNAELLFVRNALDNLSIQNVKQNEDGDIEPYENPESTIIELKTREIEITQKILELRIVLQSYKYGIFED